MRDHGNTQPSARNRGPVTQVLGNVVDIEFPPDKLPAIYNAVETCRFAGQDTPLVLEVEQLLGNNCRALRRHGADRRHEARPARLRHRRADHRAGRAGDAGPHLQRARPADGQQAGSGQRADACPIHRAAPGIEEQATKAEVLETGIKVIDLIAPFMRGGKIGTFGGAGVGKTVIIQELINNIAKELERLLGLRRRGRAHARGQRPLPRDDRTPACCDKLAMVFGQMNEPPGARLRVALTGLTIAEYFRDDEGRDVLLFIDNIFRFTQAGSEVSALLGRMPSAVGYQPNLAEEMGQLQERITSTKKGSITSMQAVYVPADDYTDPAPADDLRPPRLDHRAGAGTGRAGHLSRRWTRWPRPAASSTRSIVGQEHYDVAQEVKRVLAALQGPAGHHRDSGRGRAFR